MSLTFRGNRQTGNTLNPLYPSSDVGVSYIPMQGEQQRSGAHYRDAEQRVDSTHAYIRDKIAEREPHYNIWKLPTAL